MKLGAERKKLVLLAVLVAAAAMIFYVQLDSGPSAPSAAPLTGTSTPVKQSRSPAEELLGEGRPAAKVPRTAARNNEFRPSLKIKKGEGPPPEQRDPTLRTDLLAKVQSVEYQGAERNLFLFGKPKPTPQQVEAAKKAAEEAQKKITEAPKPAEPAPPPKPTAPPVTFKYYGYANQPGDSRKRAFLLDGDDILVAAEGEVIKKKYKVIRIGVNSLVVEDLEFHAQQTVPLTETSG